MIKKLLFCIFNLLLCNPALTKHTIQVLEDNVGLSMRIIFNMIPCDIKDPTLRLTNVLNFEIK